MNNFKNNMEKEVLQKFKDMNHDERKKLMQVLQERKDGGGGKMEWMYKEHNIDSEDYLLGRKVDKTFTDANLEHPQISSDSPGALFSEVIARRSKLDMQEKMKEDPLYVIKQKEIEARRRVLENPLKLKKLKDIVEKERKYEEHKMSKKLKRSRKDSSSSDEESDELLKKYLEIKNSKTEAKKRNENLKMENETNKIEDRRRTSRASERGSKEEGGDRPVKDNFRDHSSDEDRPRKQTKFGLEIKSDRGSYQHKQVDYRNISVKKTFQKLPKRRKLTESEKEEMRKRMISNAKERDHDRRENIKRCKDSDGNKENDELPDHASFLESMMTNLSSKSSLEDRIKRKSHSIQKSKDHFFARK